MIHVPSDKKELLDLSLMLIEQCRVSYGARCAYYQLMNRIAETGRYDGGKSLINMLYAHITRTADHLFSPVELKFAVGYGPRPRTKVEIDRAGVAAHAVTDVWECNNTDMTFGRGVFESLKLGASLLKQWVQVERDKPVYYDKLVLPWQFGVYREDENRLDRQEAMCETITLTLPEVWQRIYHLPEAKKLFEKIKVHAKHGEAGADPTSYFHQVLSASTLDTSGANNQRLGGIVQVTNDMNYQIMGPVIAADVVQMHELWVKDSEDYTTIQLIEPDIIIAPLYKKANLLVADSQMHPYTLIQPNEVTNWFWGRSELVDLIEPQSLLSTWCDDARRLMGLQIDKILGFVGEGGITDELYGQFRGAGYINLPQGASISDITPKFPPEMLPMIKFVIETINIIGGFPEIMQGRGESGVRAGVHADTLLKTGSPTLRDRSLIVERQCATAADKTLALMQAKDAENYWTSVAPASVATPDGNVVELPGKTAEDTKFLLSELPDERRVNVDSHSSSPIFSDENAQLIFQSAKLGYVTGEYVLDNLPFPNRETAKIQLREKEAKQAEFMANIMKTNPEVGNKILEKQATGRR